MSGPDCVQLFSKPSSQGKSYSAGQEEKKYRFENWEKKTFSFSKLTLLVFVFTKSGS